MSFKTLFNSPFNPLLLLQFFTLFTSLCTAAGRDDWRRRSVYQLMTDRFARTNDNDNSPCDVLKYCGGTYQGLINHLDWIQDMGFTAVSPFPVKSVIRGNFRCGLVRFTRESRERLSMATISMVWLRWPLSVGRE